MDYDISMLDELSTREKIILNALIDHPLNGLVNYGHECLPVLKKICALEGAAGELAPERKRVLDWAIALQACLENGTKPKDQLPILTPSMEGRSLLGHVVSRALFALFQVKVWPNFADGKLDFFAVPRGFHPNDRLNFLTGVYEAAEREMLQHFKPVDVIIEVGANIGVVARSAFGKLRDGGMYVCVEPNRASQEALSFNMTQTVERHKDRDYRIVPAAVRAPSDPQEIRFVERRGLDSGMADYLTVRKNETIVVLPSRTLSDLITEFAPSPARSVGVICDAEGAEIGLSRHPEEFERVSQIAIEFHKTSPNGVRNEPPQAVLQRFVDMGFRPVAHKGMCCLLTRDA